VHPALVPTTTSLGSTHGVLNGLFSVGNFVGPVFSQGPGAGREATASAVVADLVDLANGRGLPVFGMPYADLGTLVPGQMVDRVGRYYVRCGGDVDVATLTGHLAKAGVGVEAAVESACGGAAVVTAAVREGEMFAASDALYEVLDDSVFHKIIRVEGPW
jgi:homoserine dehydrogenase